MTIVAFGLGTTGLQGALLGKGVPSPVSDQTSLSLHPHETHIVNIN